MTAPAAVGDWFSVNQDTSLPIAAAAIVANDTDSDGDSLTPAVLLDRGPSYGSLTIESGSELRYTPSPGFYGNDSFTYFAWDGEEFSATAATVTIEVKQVVPPGSSSGSVFSWIILQPHEPNFAFVGPIAPDAIWATPDQYTTLEDIPLIIDGAGVLTNDVAGSDVGALSAELVAGPEHGTLTLAVDGSFRYLAVANYFGRDSFTYRAVSGESISNIAKVLLEITPVNDAPVANDDIFVAESGVPLPIGLAELLGNDHDVERDPLSAVLPLSSAPQNGRLTLAAGGIGYASSRGYVGIDKFDYFVRDAELFGAAPATVTLNVLHPRRHNSRLAEDVNNDQVVSPLDAVLIINHFNNVGVGRVLDQAALTFDYLDVSNDGVLSPLDAVQVINVLNGRSAGDGSSGPRPGGSALEDANAASPTLEQILAAMADEAAQVARRRRGMR